MAWTMTGPHSYNIRGFFDPLKSVEQEGFAETLLVMLGVHC